MNLPLPPGVEFKELRLHEPEGASHQVRRETLERGIVLVDGVVEDLPGRGDLVFRDRQLLLRGDQRRQDRRGSFLPLRPRQVVVTS